MKKVLGALAVLLVVTLGLSDASPAHASVAAHTWYDAAGTTTSDCSPPLATRRAVDLRKVNEKPVVGGVLFTAHVTDLTLPRSTVCGASATSYQFLVEYWVNGHVRYAIGTVGHTGTTWADWRQDDKNIDSTVGMHMAYSTANDWVQLKVSSKGMPDGAHITSIHLDQSYGRWARTAASDDFRTNSYL
ncbi:hypothetical protein [Nocardioides montaniterrae]